MLFEHQAHIHNRCTPSADPLAALASQDGSSLPSATITAGPVSQARPASRVTPSVPPGTVTSQVFPACPFSACTFPPCPFPARPSPPCPSSPCPSPACPSPPCPVAVAAAAAAAATAPVPHERVSPEPRSC